MIRDSGRYHKLPWGGGQLTIPRDLVKHLKLKSKDKVMIEYDEKEQVLRIRKL